MSDNDNQKAAKEMTPAEATALGHKYLPDSDQKGALNQMGITHQLPNPVARRVDEVKLEQRHA